MNYTLRKEAVKGEPYDFRKDFKVLTSSEKQEILKTAKHLESIQAENQSFFVNVYSLVIKE